MEYAHADLIFYFKVLQSWIHGHWKSLKDFEFAPYNPLFWLFFLLTIMVLSRIWEIKKAISYCTIVAVILLVATWLEGLMDVALLASGESFDVAIIKIVAFCMITCVSVIYMFIVK